MPFLQKNDMGGSTPGLGMPREDTIAKLTPKDRPAVARREMCSSFPERWMEQICRKPRWLQVNRQKGGVSRGVVPEIFLLDLDFPG